MNLSPPTTEARTNSFYAVIHYTSVVGTATPEGYEEHPPHHGTLQVASGIVGTMLNFVNDCKEGSFCEKLYTYLFWLHLATFGVNAITERILLQSDYFSPFKKM